MPHSKTRRYERQICLPEIGKQGQKKLGNTNVLVVGAGGLGSVSCLYLAAAGFGNITIVDQDCVEISNLNRQILHNETSIGQPKVSSAAARMKALNSSIKVTTVHDKLTADNINTMLQNIDIILDGCDNYETRTIINRASIKHNLPWIFGGVQAFEGMISTFVPGVTACFECIVPKPKKTKLEPGIIGPTAGIISSMQTMEAIKLILNIGTPLKNKLFKISGLTMRVQTLNLEPNPDCPACNIYQTMGKI